MRQGKQVLKIFGEKVFRNVLIDVVLKFQEVSRWYGRVREMVVLGQGGANDHVRSFTIIPIGMKAMNTSAPLSMKFFN